MHKALACILIGALALVGSGCTTNNQNVAPHAQGGAGESCASRNDCKAGLACIDNRCVKPGEADTGEPDEEQDAGVVMATGARGGRGESCQARNDCEDGLACIHQMCVEADVMLTMTTKQCVRVQCEADEDCCAGFVKPSDCPTWQNSCKSEGDGSYQCSQFQSMCQCHQVCQANMCRFSNTCKHDVDCGSSGLHCFSGMCAQCKKSSDCPGTNQQCVAGECRASCVHDEQCPLFSACQSGKCVSVGCKSDRECYFATQDPLSYCKDTKCITPCTEDAACGDFQICNQDQCVFVGCESDAECRAVLGTQNVSDGERAVCRAPDE